VNTWHVDFREAFDRWIADYGPSDAQINAFYEWGFRVTQEGPPADAEPVPGDLDRFVWGLHAADVIVQYLAIAQDRLMILKEIIPS